MVQQVGIATQDSTLAFCTAPQLRVGKQLQGVARQLGYGAGSGQTAGGAVTGATESWQVTVPHLSSPGPYHICGVASFLLKTIQGCSYFLFNIVLDAKAKSISLSINGEAHTAWLVTGNKSSHGELQW